jgi:hypothetical protein
MIAGVSIIINSATRTIGLLASPQLVARVVAENFILRDNDAPHQNITIDRSGWYTQAEPRVLSRPYLEEVAKRLWAVGQANVSLLQQGAVPLGWLLRAWAERTSVFEFMALFVALEVVVNWYDPDEEDQTQQQKKTQAAKRIRSILKKYGGADNQELIDYFNELRAKEKPTLVSRFTTLAKKAQMPNWEKDVAAFSQFNQVRNDIVHRGRQHVSFFVEISPEEVHELEKFAKRYIRWALQDRS